MSHNLFLDADLGLVVVRYTGLVDLAELDEVRQQIESHAEFRPGLNRIWDERDCDIQVSHQELVTLATKWASSGVNHGQRKLAYLVKQDLSWGFNRVFEAYRDNPDLDYELFRDFGAARQWLGLPETFKDPGDWLHND